MHSEKDVILAVDNSTIHKTKDAIKFITDSNIPMITIPPYEPSLNQVENFIRAIKCKLIQKSIEDSNYNSLI